MAAITDSSEEKADSLPPAPLPSPSLPNDFKTKIESKTLGDAGPWIDHAVQQALLYQKTIEETMASAIEVSRSRISQIRSSSSAHFQQTIESLRNLKSDYGAYEAMLFEQVKEGINVAVSHPLITGGVAIGLGFLTSKRSRRFLYYNSLRLFLSEEALLSRADVKVKELRKSIDHLKVESEKLERSASLAEQDLIRGRTKLRQAGKQIQSAIQLAYKCERQAAGLNGFLRELPRREASRFRSQVSNLVSEAKQEKNALIKEVTKIGNYGISV